MTRAVPGRPADRPWPRRAKFGVCVLALTGAVLVTVPAGRTLVVTRDIEAPDGVISLASHEWERLPATARVALRTPTAKVLLSEPVKLNSYNCHDCGRRVEVLEQEGIERDRIVMLERKVTRTFDEALAVREWALQTGARRVMVVTSPYHTRRALATFESVLAGTGIAVGVHPAEFSEARPDAWLLRAYDRKYVAYEWSAALFYRVRFGVSLSFVR